MAHQKLEYLMPEHRLDLWSLDGNRTLFVSIGKLRLDVEMERKEMAIKRRKRREKGASKKWFWEGRELNERKVEEEIKKSEK